jgi:serine/threonine-protein kinase
MAPFTKNLSVVGGTIALAAFLIGYAVTSISFLRAGAPIDVVTVPDVREMRVTDATRALEQADLTLSVGDSFPNAARPAGSILAQSPLPGQEVSPGTEIRVIIAAGEDRPRVPNVDGMPIAEASRTLRVAGFDFSVVNVPVEGETGTVISMSPAAGTPVALPVTIRLEVGSDPGFFGSDPGYVDSEPGYVDVPNLVGIFERAAREITEAAGLRVGEVEYVRNEEYEVGSVVGQEPPAGERVLAGSEVRLRVRSLSANGLIEDPGSDVPGTVASRMSEEVGT